jgi:hypothetical protein
MVVESYSIYFPRKNVDMLNKFNVKYKLCPHGMGRIVSTQSHMMKPTLCVTQGF